MVMIGKCRSAKSCLLVGLLLHVFMVLPTTAWSQSQRWIEIYDRAGDAYRAGKLTRALQHAKQARVLAERTTTSNQDSLAQCLNLEAVLLVRLGRTKEAEPLYKRALLLREQNLRPGDPRIAESLNNSASLSAQLGQLDEALALHKKALAIRHKALGPNHPDVAQSLNNLANVELALGRPEKARPLLQRALTILSDNNDNPYLVWTEKLPDFGQSSPNAAVRHVGKGGMTIRSAIPPGLLAAGQSSQPGDASPVDLSNATSSRKPRLNGRPAGSGVSDKAPQAAAPKTKPTTRRVSAREADLAVSLVNLGMMAQMTASSPPDGSAAKLYQRAIEIQEKVLGPDHPDLAASLNNLAELKSIQRKYAKAEQLHMRALAIREKSLGPNDPHIALSLTNLARLYGTMQRPKGAIPLLEQAVKIGRTVLGNQHPDVVLSLRSLALAHAASGNFGKALSLHRQATGLVRQHALSIEASNGILNPEQVHTSKGRIDYHFQSHIAALYRAAETGAELPNTALSEAFELVQQLGQSAAARALSQMAARFGQGSGQLAKAVRTQQDLAGRWGLLDKQLLRAISAPSNQSDNERTNSLRKEMASVEGDIWSLSTSIKRKFPDYVDLASPAPVTVADLQKLLNRDEALVQFHLGDFGNYAWLITKNSARWVRLSGRPGTVDNLVRALRCGLDSRAWQGFGGSTCQQLLKTDYHSMDYDAGKSLPFDLKLAHQLYQILFGKFEPDLKGKRLLVVASGALTQIPLHVLATDAPKEAVPTDPRDYAKAPWLMKSHPISMLPAVTSLRSLRRHASRSKAPNSFVGFGNPLLTGPNGTDKRAFVSQSCTKTMQRPNRNILASRAVHRSVSSLVREGIGDVAALRAQGPLPGTAIELCSISRTLGASDADVYLGARATEAMVKTLNARGELARTRVLQFATHALVAAETEDLARSLAEPSLMLTPPDKASIHDDGLLTASEVMQLKLDADWVVLSACNTAAPRGKGNAEPLSGLARAFFYAGARALLVSHWYVDSRAATLLTTGAFAQMIADPTVQRSEAMRRAMLRAMKDDQRPQRWIAAAHPSVWAPFVLVGDGS
ncbi:MAG: CHAT domain-containing protein/tetratricopeptide (TPR) repeat protein [Hyphomicrobiaceae bacterium]|jgi:CHAT domain-containing protein/tetratricopeptide (TPR) repeat protein